MVKIGYDFKRSYIIYPLTVLESRPHYAFELLQNHRAIKHYHNKHIKCVPSKAVLERRQDKWVAIVFNFEGKAAYHLVQEGEPDLAKRLFKDALANLTQLHSKFGLFQGGID